MVIEEYLLGFKLQQKTLTYEGAAEKSTRKKMLWASYLLLLRLNWK